MKVYDLPTPALIADEDILSANAERMNEILAGKKLRLRPHYKSHKCAAIAHRQIAAGAVGMTCAKLSEAEDLAYSGVEDILLANQIADPEKIFRLALLAAKCRLTVCVDDEENAEALSRAAAAVGSTVHVLVEYDIGMRRCGLRTPEDYLRVARKAASLPNLEYDGIQAYAGYASHESDTETRRRMTEENERKVSALADMLEKNGLAVRVISGGSTGTAQFKAAGGLYTELQAGSYLFLDSTYNQLDFPFRNSLFVLSTVMSVNGGDVMLDAGVKSLGVDQELPLLYTLDGKRITGEMELNEEHLKLFGASEPLTLGQKVKIIPGHCCSTVNLYDRLTLFSGDRVTERLEITARGKSL